MKLEALEQENLNKKIQLQQLGAIGFYAPSFASTSIGCVGEGSSRPSASHSYSDFGPIIFWPRVRKSKLDSYFMQQTTPSSQISLEKTSSLNKEIHDAAKKQICKFWYFCNTAFIAAR